ncbi:unnamed protein product [Rodentolepis nana]|uniref:Uncharacterized protein n=1 Tax=Rodentolepis nana TaxID=102285 RepID=A0A158QHP5_RODNA|nr:unnamed protein product [Rodentolepis nana]
MPPARRKPPSKVVKFLSGTEFTSGLFSPWLCELRQESLLTFCDLANRLIKRLEVSPEFFSFFPESPLTDHLVESKKRQDSFEPVRVTNGSASVICIDNMWHWDPISAVSAYFRSASLIDQILTRLPCSSEGHTYVDWSLLRQLPNPDDILLVLIRLIWLLPSRGCNPNSHSTAPLIEAINNLFATTISADTLRDSAVGRFLDAFKQESIGLCLFVATYRRHLLSAYRYDLLTIFFCNYFLTGVYINLIAYYRSHHHIYFAHCYDHSGKTRYHDDLILVKYERFTSLGRESLRNAGFPQLIPPVVQMCRDLAEAHREPSKASPALQSLRHRLNATTTRQFDSESSQHDPSLFSNVSKLISMSGIGVGRRTPQPYSPNLIILVVYGTMTWSLAREIVDAVTRSSPRCVQLPSEGTRYLSTVPSLRYSQCFLCSAVLHRICSHKSIYIKWQAL